MHVLILTSRDHAYANLALNQVIRSGVLDEHTVTVFEQEWIIPSKSKVRGVVRYLKKSGVYYVIAQIMKQLLFQACRWLQLRRNNTQSPHFPYYINPLRNFSRRTLHGLKSKSAVQHIRDIAPDLILSVFSKEIIPQSIIEIPKYCCVNVHPALLPLYRGVSPIFWSLVNGEDTVGVTLHYIDAGVDTGAIISQREIPVGDLKTEHSLYMQCAKSCGDLMVDFLTHLNSSPDVPVETQPNPKEGTYYSLPSKEAVGRFRKRGFRFFRLREFTSKGSREICIP